jgi:type IX secretion system PorP/SprF family membrane protein
MKKWSFLLVVLLVSLPTFAQQLTQYSQWYLHQFAINPAHAGIKPCIDIHSLYRVQWVGFEGAPQSGFLTLSIPLQTRGKRAFGARHGTGFKFESDQFGPFSMTRLNLAYAAHFNFTQDNRLSLGAYGGVVQTGYDASSLTSHDPDPEILQQSNVLSPDATFGAWYNSTNYFLGFSLRNLFRSRWENVGFESRDRFHASLNGGYRWSVHENWTLLPGFNLRIPPRSPISLDINLQADYNNVFSVGFGFRAGDAVNATAVFKIREQFAIAYTFDYSISRIQSVAQNTHELSLRFTTCKPDRRSGASCPLFE